MGRGVSVWVLEAPDGFGDPQFHAHHAIQLTCSLSGNLALENEEREIEGRALAVDADALHRFAAHGVLAFVFVEPESRHGQALRERLFMESSLVQLIDQAAGELLLPLERTFEDDLTPRELLRIGQALVDRLAGSEPERAPDPRVERIIDFAHANLDRPLTLSTASEGVYLSPSRLRHLFVEQTGLAFKTYLLWLRLMRALEIYAGGRSLTEAAHGAGFSDSAHFSRIFKRTFGLPATTLTRL
jgi:AraC family transcriptional regulator